MKRERSATYGAAFWKTEQGEVDVRSIGDREILKRKYLGLICSVQCPGSMVIKTFEAIRELRDAGIVIAGGFHSPMEKECLEFLLRGDQPVIVMLAKGLCRLRLPEPWRRGIDAGRLLILSIHGDEVRRTTRAYAQARNEFIVAHAAAVLVPHASPGGMAEAIAQAVLLERSKPLFTFDQEENRGLLQWGAIRFGVAEVQRRIQPDSPRNCL
jgi:hypothetical protein